MHDAIMKAATIAGVVLLSATICIAAENKPVAASDTSKAATTEKSVKAKKAKSAPTPKFVDINSASKAELKKLPGIGDAEADKIIAGRPYLTKANLVTRNILPAGIYESLKRQIVAKQK